MPSATETDRRLLQGGNFYGILVQQSISGCPGPAVWLAGRIGKQVQNLRGTAAVMDEPEPNCMSLHFGVGRQGEGHDARAGRPALEFILPGMAVQTAAVPGAGPVLRTDQTFARKTKVHRVLVSALFLYGSVRLLQPKQALSFCGAAEMVCTIRRKLCNEPNCTVQLRWHRAV